MDQASVTGLTTMGSGFDPRPVLVGFLRKNGGWEGFFFEYFLSTLSL
jgi:hypothetical protein